MFVCLMVVLIQFLTVAGSAAEVLARWAMDTVEKNAQYSTPGSSENGNGLQLMGAPAPEVMDGVVGKAIRFNASASNFGVAEKKWRKPQANNEVYVDFHVNPDSVDVATGQAVLAANGVWEFRIVNNILFFYVYDLQKAPKDARVSGVLKKGTWTHVTGTVSGQNITLTMDGKTATGKLASPKMNQRELEIFVGAANTNGTRAFSGALDDITIANQIP